MLCNILTLMRQDQKENAFTDISIIVVQIPSIIAVSVMLNHFH